MLENTEKFLSQLEIGRMPNVIELMSAIDTMSDEMWEAFLSSQSLTEATNACRQVARHGKVLCSEC